MKNVYFNTNNLMNVLRNLPNSFQYSKKTEEPIQSTTEIVMTKYSHNMLPYCERDKCNYLKKSG